MGLLTVALVGLVGMQPLANAFALPHLNHLQKHALLKRALHTEVVLTTLIEYVTVTDDGKTHIDASTSVSSVSSSVSSSISTTAPGAVFNALTGDGGASSNLPASVNIPISIAQAPAQTTAQSSTSTSAAQTTAQQTYSAPAYSPPSPSKTDDDSDGSPSITNLADLPDFSADTHYKCAGGDNTITLSGADEITRTVYWAANVIPSAPLKTPEPVVVGPGDVKEVSVDCGWSGNWWARSVENEGCTKYMLGEASFQGWQYITYYDVSAVDNLTDNTGVKWLYPTDGSADLSGCENYSDPDKCTHYYKFPTDDANGTNGMSPTLIKNVFKVGLTCILGSGTIPAPY